MCFGHVFLPLTLRHKTLRNRIVFGRIPPTWHKTVCPEISIWPSVLSVPSVVCR